MWKENILKVINLNFELHTTSKNFYYTNLHINRAYLTPFPNYENENTNWSPDRLSVICTSWNVCNPIVGESYKNRIAIFLSATLLFCSHGVPRWYLSPQTSLFDPKFLANFPGAVTWQYFSWSMGEILSLIGTYWVCDWLHCLIVSLAGLHCAALVSYSVQPPHSKSRLSYSDLAI